MQSVESTIVKKSKIQTLQFEDCQRNPIQIKEAGTKNGSIPTAVLRSNKKSCHKEIKTRFISIFNLNNAIIVSSIKMAFNNLKEPNTIADVFQDLDLVNNKTQPHNSERILCKSKFALEPEVFYLRKCG